MNYQRAMLESKEQVLAAAIDSAKMAANQEATQGARQRVSEGGMACPDGKDFSANQAR